MQRQATQSASLIVIHIEQDHGAFADCGQADDAIATHFKVVVPILRSRIEEWNNFSIHQRREIWPLLKIAPMARKAEIGAIVRSAVLLRDDVLDVERRKGQVILM